MKRPPWTRPGTWPEHRAGSFAARIERDRLVPGDVALLGLPDDTGVRLNHGRPGAAGGPLAFRAALSRLGAAAPAGKPWPAVSDAGDVVPGASLAETHARVTEAAAALLESDMLPVAIGGGHDLTFPLARAVLRRFPGAAAIYFDAHLDVRPEDGSGMAFRRLVEECAVAELHLHGFRPFVNSQEHLEWFLGHGGHVHPDDAVPALPPRPGAWFASFDLDVLDAAHAPGVSAANPAGWTPREAERWVRILGHDRRVRCFDLMELNPAHDHDGQTARLASHLFLAFLSGVAARE